MDEPTIKIPQHLIYFYNMAKNYESSFGKKAKSLGVNTNEILILMEIYDNDGLNQLILLKDIISQKQISAK